jgi:hypothetical protein
LCSESERAKYSEQGTLVVSEWTKREGEIMRVRRWMVVLTIIASLCWKSCGSRVEQEKGLTAAQRAEVEDGVRKFTVTVAQDVTREGPMAWLKHFEDGPEFFMAVNGQLAFPSGQMAAKAIPTVASKYKSIVLRWGDDLRVDALTENLCVVGMSYNEISEFSAEGGGGKTNQSGYFTGLAEKGGGRWQFRDAHWSVPESAAKVP